MALWENQMAKKAREGQKRPMWVAVSLLNVSIDLAEITPLHFYWEPFCGLISSTSLMAGSWGPMGDPRWHQAGGIKYMYSD